MNDDETRDTIAKAILGCEDPWAKSSICSDHAGWIARDVLTKLRAMGWQPLDEVEPMRALQSAEFARLVAERDAAVIAFQAQEHGSVDDFVTRLKAQEAQEDAERALCEAQRLLAEMSCWIACDTAMPLAVTEDGCGSCQIFDRRFGVQTAHYHNACAYGWEWFIGPHEEARAVSDITHWRPLPLPPGESA